MIHGLKDVDREPFGFRRLSERIARAQHASKMSLTRVLRFPKAERATPAADSTQPAELLGSVGIRGKPILKTCPPQPGGRLPCTMPCFTSTGMERVHSQRVHSRAARAVDQGPCCAGNTWVVVLGVSFDSQTRGFPNGGHDVTRLALPSLGESGCPPSLGPPH